MSLEALIAVRYLFATRTRSVANTISWISLVGLLVSTAALVVVLSVYNGIGELTKGLFSAFDPELVIEPAEGKTFHTSSFDYDALCHLQGVAAASAVVSENAWLTYRDQQAIVTLRGVDDHYRFVSGLDTLVREGRYHIDDALLVGGEIWYELGMNARTNLPVALHIPRRGSTAMGYTMEQAFNTAYAVPAGCFFIQQDIDRRYVITSIDMVRRLMNYAPDECTAIALKLQSGYSAKQMKRHIASWLQQSQLPLVVKDRYDQQPLYFKIFRTERLGIYLVLSIIVLISTLSLAASLSLLIINKRHDIFAMRSMGMTRRRLRRAFMAEGVLVCSVGVVVGLVVGFVVCFVQQQFGIVRMGDGNFVVNAFPVAMRAVDFVATFLVVMTISSLTVLFTVRRSAI